jgi:tRNA(Ile)-lysidine synthase TilS/MesJ
MSKQLRSKLLRSFREGVKEFNLITPSDVILIGLSGGKDSLALLDLMGDMLRRSNNGFTLHALHVRMVGVDYLSDTDYLREQCERHKITYHERLVGFDADRNEKRTPCFLCSWNRRKTLFEVAQELGCNKIALGHHQDDILHTALMNLSYAGSFSTMPCLLKMQKMPLTIIRPLCKVKEALLKEWSIVADYQPLVKLCPHERASKRTEIAMLFEQLELQNPEFRANLWNALLKAGKLVETSKGDAPNC